MNLQNRWQQASEAAMESFLESRKASSEMSVVESGDGTKTTTKRVRSAGPGDAAFLKMHLECLREIERLEYPALGVPDTVEDDDGESQPKESADWRALLNDRPSDESEEGKAGKSG